MGEERRDCRPSADICECVNDLLIYLTSEQLSIAALQKEILLAISKLFNKAQPTLCHSVSFITLGIAGHTSDSTTACIQPGLGLASTPSHYGATSGIWPLPSMLVYVLEKSDHRRM